jgi:hypothetical protein
LVWQPLATQPAQHVWGLSYERSGVHERVSLDLMRFGDSGIEIEAHRPEATLTRKTADSRTGDARRLLETLRADGVELSVRLEPEPKPVSVAHPDKSSHFQPDSLRGTKLRATLAELSALAARSLPEAAQLDLQGVGLRFRRGNDELNFGPSTLRVTRLGAQVELSFVPKAEAAGTPLELKLSLPIAAGEVHAQLRGGPVSLRSLGIREGDFGLTGVQTASLQASGDVTLAPDGSTLAFSGSGVADHVSLSRAELSPSPLSGIRLGFRARGTTTLDASTLTLEDGELSFGDVRVDGNGMLARGEHTVQTHWSGGVPLASCQALLEATPRGLAPLIAGMRLSGTFAVKADLDYDSQRPSETRVHLDVANDCRIDQVPPELSPHRFEAPWQREVKGADRLPMEIESGPGTPDWVPYDSISPFMETAVLVCEDGHFERHHGFDFEAIENSIRDNLIQGRFARGASTISMQLAKNLYLGKEESRAQAAGSGADRSARAAARQAGDDGAVLERDRVRPWDLRDRAGGSLLLREARQRSVAWPSAVHRHDTAEPRATALRSRRQGERGLDSLPAAPDAHRQEDWPGDGRRASGWARRTGRLPCRGLGRGGARDGAGRGHGHAQRAVAVALASALGSAGG